MQYRVAVNSCRSSGATLGGRSEAPLSAVAGLFEPRGKP